MKTYILFADDQIVCCSHGCLKMVDEIKPFLKKKMKVTTQQLTKLKNDMKVTTTDGVKLRIERSILI